jgi:hypothetical protein
MAGKPSVFSSRPAKDVFYVALSRARFEATIYTNDCSNLPFAVGREYMKFAALDIGRIFEKQG